MIAIFHLMLCCTTGMLIIYLSRNIFITKEFSAHFPKWLLYIPASFTIGVLVCGCLTYIASYIFAKSSSPIAWGNTIVITLQIMATFYLYHLKKNDITRLKNFNPRKFFKQNYLAVVLFVVAIAYISIISIQSFHYDGSLLKLGASTYGDFGVHTAIMRSFSKGSNFPTQYPHFPDGTIRYHFMFQFFCGNLEFLGLPLDWAINLPSILAFAFFIMMFYYFVTIVTKQKGIAFIACLLLFFRSSLAFIDYFKNASDNIFKALISSPSYIGLTPKEDWGLYSANVYINQRHMSFALCVLILMLIALVPLFDKMMTSLASRSHSRFKTSILSKDAWVPESYTRAIVCGILIGTTGFWNGSVLITLLVMLFVIALCSKHRLEFLIIAVISCLLFLLQVHFFAGASATDTSSIIRLGYLTDFSSLPPEIVEKIHSINSIGSLLSSISVLPIALYHTLKAYILPLLGIMPLLTILGIILSRKGTRWLSLAFLAPMVFAFVTSLTNDVTVNHKYVMISITFLNIFCATFVYYLFTITKQLKTKNIFLNLLGKIIALVLIVGLTTTGVIDYFSAINQNTRYATISEENPIYIWAKENTNPRSVFLTEPAVLGPFLFAGRNLSYGHGFFAWSAGYDVSAREELVNQTYLSASPEELRKNATELGADYIVVSNVEREMMANRGYPDFSDAVIKETYPEVFTFDDMSIYQVR